MLNIEPLEKNRHPRIERLMNLQSLLEMTNYLAAAPRTFDQIAKHIALVTFADESVQTIFIGMLEPDGRLHEAGRFGYSTDDLDGPIIIPVSQITPIREVLKGNRAGVYFNRPNIFQQFPDGKRYPAPPQWKSLIAIPIDDFGVIVIFFENKVEENPTQQLHWQMVGSLVSLHILRTHQDIENTQAPNHESLDNSDSAMTERQLVILKMIERGLTNGQIAQEVGYSESLIRQETVHIFRKLKVSGRKEILNNSHQVGRLAENLQNNPSTRG